MFSSDSPEHDTALIVMTIKNALEGIFTRCIAWQKHSRMLVDRVCVYYNHIPAKYTHKTGAIDEGHYEYLHFSTTLV